MKDNLEKFVQEHRDEFDQHELPGKVWVGVKKRLLHKQRRRYRIYYGVAASILLIASVWALLVRHNPQQDTTQVSATVAVAPEIKEAQSYYASMVAAKRNELKQYGNDYPDLFKDFDSELDTLTVAFTRLETEYRKSDGNEAVMQALIKNMQLQVELLNRQMQIIQDVRKNSRTKGRSSLM